MYIYYEIQADLFWDQISQGVWPKGVWPQG